MKLLIIHFAVSFLFVSAYSQESKPKNAEDSIRVVVQNYFDGIMQYDLNKLQTAFHPDATISTIYLGRINSYYNGTFTEWSQFIRQKTSESIKDYSNKIISIDIKGYAATVKTELIWPTMEYTDYLSLLRFENGWKIVNKIWYQLSR